MWTPTFLILALLSLLPSDWAYTQMSAMPMWQVRRIVTEELPSGSGSWTVPSDVTMLISVECWGGGGSSARTGTGTFNYGGGGGGAFSKSTDIAVLPNSNIDYLVGLGGAPAIAGFDGQHGGNSRFGPVASPIVLAEGGKGSVIDTINFPGGAGGSVSNGIGSLKTGGGTGGNALIEDSGGGGGGAAGSPSGTGGNGTNNSGNRYGGSSPGAGAGGTSTATSGNPGADHVNGGGGGAGGAHAQSGGAGGYPGGGAGAAGDNASAGAGGNGKIRLTYVRLTAN